MTQLIATRPLPTLGVREGQSFPAKPRQAQRLVQRGLATRAPTPPRRLADGRINPGALTGPLAWFPDWRGKTAIVLASGPSAKDADLEVARGRAEVLAVNESWRLAPWASALYGCDGTWWLSKGGVPEFAGLKVTQDVTASTAYGLRRVRLHLATGRMHMDVAGEIGGGSRRGGGNSGFQALNLALQFGAARILLVGFDMSLAGGVHWHGAHPARLNNPSARAIGHWAEVLDAVAPAIADLGVEVLNCSPPSALAAYRKANLAEALGG